MSVDPAKCHYFMLDLSFEHADFISHVAMVLLPLLLWNDERVDDQLVTPFNPC